jgi:thioredoxin 1
VTVLNASDPVQLRSLIRAVEPSTSWLVACLCAAWCKTCDEYRETFDALSALHPDWAFAWVDIEDEADLVGDHDIEDFPTLLVQRGDNVLFLGALTPQRVGAGDRQRARSAQIAVGEVIGPRAATNTPTARLQPRITTRRRGPAPSVRARDRHVLRQPSSA